MYIIKGLHSCRTKLNILNALASYRCFLFKISTTSHVVHMLIFVILIRHINTKLLKSCSESQKLLKVAKIEKSSKVAQKLPRAICLGLVQCQGLKQSERVLSQHNFCCYTLLNLQTRSVLGSAGVMLNSSVCGIECILREAN